MADVASDEAFPKACVIAGIFRDETGEFVVPRGMRELRSGDQLFLCADTTNIGRAAAYLRTVARK